jgi:MHS family alpha-ketoglutarate permease-like MFS transporter
LIAFLLICAAWIFVAGYTSINAIVKAELFPTNVRALGVGLTMRDTKHESAMHRHE